MDRGRTARLVVRRGDVVCGLGKLLQVEAYDCGDATARNADGIEIYGRDVLVGHSRGAGPATTRAIRRRVDHRGRSRRVDGLWCLSPTDDATGSGSGGTAASREGGCRPRGCQCPLWVVAGEGKPS